MTSPRQHRQPTADEVLAAYLREQASSPASGSADINSLASSANAALVAHRAEVTQAEQDKAANEERRQAAVNLLIRQFREWARTHPTDWSKKNVDRKDYLDVVPTHGKYNFWTSKTPIIGEDHRWVLTMWRYDGPRYDEKTYRHPRWRIIIPVYGSAKTEGKDTPQPDELKQVIAEIMVDVGSHWPYPDVPWPSSTPT